MIEEKSRVPNPVVFIVRDPDDSVWGPFDSGEVAGTWAAKKWPHVPEYDPDALDQHASWEVQRLRTPDDVQVVGAER